MMMIDGIEVDGGGFGNLSNGGGGGSFIVSSAPPAALIGSNTPTTQYDLSVLAGLRPQDKYLGRNRVSDITEAYQTYISGSPVGRGGQYAVDAARKYGTTLTEAARGYLEAVGLPILQAITGGGNGGGGTGNGGGGTGGGGTDTNTQKIIDDLNKRLDEQKKTFEDAQEKLKKQLEDVGKNLTDNNVVKILSDQLSTLFGNAVYNSPLQSQATGYTPVTTSSPIGGAITGGGGGSSIGLYLIIGVVGVIGYFVYKRFKG